MSDTWTVIGTGIGLLAVLVPLLLGLTGQLRSEVAEIRRDLHDLDRRVARIEGRLDAVLPAITLPGSPSGGTVPSPAAKE